MGALASGEEVWDWGFWAEVSWSRADGGGGGGAGVGWYFMGDSLARKSRREGSRSRRGSVEESLGGEDFSQNQPIVGVITG